MELRNYLETPTEMSDQWLLKKGLVKQTIFHFCLFIKFFLCDETVNVRPSPLLIFLSNKMENVTRLPLGLKYTDYGQIYSVKSCPPDPSLRLEVFETNTIFNPIEIL
jgi:hypothetical protein